MLDLGLHQHTDIELARMVYDEIDVDHNGVIEKMELSNLLKVSKVQSERERASRMEHCSWHFYYSSLLQTCYIAIVTYLLYSKSPKQVFFNVINIRTLLPHSVTLS